MLKLPLLRRTIAPLVVASAAISLLGRLQAEDKNAAPPTVGSAAPDFELRTLAAEKVKLSALTKDGPVVLVVLRGYPGYQCPLCNIQAGQFLSTAKKFADKSARIVFVYPGPGKDLAARAKDFLRGKTLPENVYFVIDPDYALTNAYRLRWDEMGETAYPSTFVIDAKGVVTFAKVSKTHGDRAKAEDALAAIP